MIETLFTAIDRGREGKNHGIPIGMPKLEEVIDGVVPSCYTLIMSNSGSGKTSYVLYSYIYKAIMNTLDNDNYKVFVFSLEMNELSLITKLLSIYIFETYGVCLSYKEILSQKKDYILSDENYNIIRECSPWIEKISNKLEIYDKRVTAKSAYGIIKKKLSEVGTFKETETSLKYIPNNPDLIYNFVIDHIGLIALQQGHSLKQEIDELSSMLVWFREKCGASFTVVQQANREQGNIERFKAGKSAFTINDAKDSGNTVQDCNIFLAIYNPFRDALKTYKTYDITRLKSCYRSILVLKNRFGECDVEVATSFYGGINVFNELPRADEIYDYDKYETPMWILDKTGSKPKSTIFTL